MLIVNLTIKGKIWSVHINEDSAKLGCNYLDNEIWVNGDRGEIIRNLRRFMTVACDCEYGDDTEPSFSEIEYVCDKIMNAYGIKL